MMGFFYAFVFMIIYYYILKKDIIMRNFLKTFNLITMIICMGGLFYAYYYDNIKDMLLFGFIYVANVISIHDNG